MSSENFVDVRYRKNRILTKLNKDDFFEHVGPDQMVDLFATKFDHWSYEEETRLLVPFSEQVDKDNLIFHPFSDELSLKEVIVGPRSDITINSIEKALSGLSVEVFQSRLAFKKFQVTRQRNKNLLNS